MRVQSIRHYSANTLEPITGAVPLYRSNKRPLRKHASSIKEKAGVLASTLVALVSSTNCIKLAWSPCCATYIDSIPIRVDAHQCFRRRKKFLVIGYAIFKVRWKSTSRGNAGPSARRHVPRGEGGGRRLWLSLSRRWKQKAIPGAYWYLKSLLI